MSSNTNAQLTFEDSLTPDRIEYAYGLAIRFQHDHRQSFADTGWRAAVARDPKLLKALEKMTERTGALQEDQIGRTMRDPSATIGESKGTTAHQLCREAYKMADAGTPLRNFEWIYGAAAWLCGYGG